MQRAKLARRSLFSAGFILSCVWVVWYMAQPVYFARETHGVGCSAIWHNDEAFVFLNNNRIAHALKRYQVFLGMVSGVSPGFYPKRSREDLLVFCIKRNALETYRLPAFGSGGFGFPINGRLYFCRGGDSKDWPYVWQWNGATFIRLEKGAGLEIIDSFPPLGSLPHSVSEQLRQEEWSAHPFLIFNKGTPMRYPLNGFDQPYTIVTSRSQTASGTETVVLEDASGHTRATLSVIDDCRYRPITEQEYLELGAK